MVSLGFSLGHALSLIDSQSSPETVAALSALYSESHLTQSEFFTLCAKQSLLSRSHKTALSSDSLVQSSESVTLVQSASATVTLVPPDFIPFQFDPFRQALFSPLNESLIGINYFQLTVSANDNNQC